MPAATLTPQRASRSSRIATALADSPSTAAAIESGRATEILQPVTEAVRTNTDIAFITIMSPDGTRFTHTDPHQIGGHYLGTIEPALRGETFTEVYTGTLGPSVRDHRARTQRVRKDRRAGVGGHHPADPRAALAIPVADHRGGKPWGAGDFVGRSMGDPAAAAAADPRAAPRRASGDVRTPRRDPAFGVRRAGRARPQRGGTGQRRGAAAARPAAWPRRPVRSARVPAHLQPRRARRGACHRRSGARGQPVAGRQPIAGLRSRHDP